MNKVFILLSFSLFFSSCKSLDLLHSKSKRMAKAPITTTRTLTMLSSHPLFLGNSDQEFSYPSSQREWVYERGMYELSAFFTWFKNKVDFPISDGIQKKSRDSVLEGLQNIRSLLKDFDFESFSGYKKPEVMVLQSLNKMSQDRLDIFLENRNVQDTDYRNLSDDYQIILKDAANCCHETLYSNRILRDFIEKENQVAFVQAILMGVSVVTLTVGTVYAGLLALIDEETIKYAERYDIQLKACKDKKGKIPSLISENIDKQNAGFCSKSQEEIESFGGNYGLIMCETRRKLMNCLSSGE